MDAGKVVGQGARLARVVLAGGDDGGAAVPQRARHGPGPGEDLHGLDARLRPGPGRLGDGRGAEARGRRLGRDGPDVDHLEVPPGHELDLRARRGRGLRLEEVGEHVRGLRPLGLVDLGPLVVVDVAEVGFGVPPDDLEHGRVEHDRPRPGPEQGLVGVMDAALRREHDDVLEELVHLDDTEERRLVVAVVAAGARARAGPRRHCRKARRCCPRRCAARGPRGRWWSLDRSAARRRALRRRALRFQGLSAARERWICCGRRALRAGSQRCSCAQLAGVARWLTARKREHSPDQSETALRVS